MIFVIVVVVGILLVVAISVTIGTAAIEARKEVYRAPRIPMYLCDTCGATFPTKHAIQLSVPQEGAQDLRVAMCTFCYHRKMQEAEKIFKP